jgi:hypothetical protein
VQTPCSTFAQSYAGTNTKILVNCQASSRDSVSYRGKIGNLNSIATWLGEGSSFGTNEKGWEALDIRKGGSKTEQDLHQLGKDIGAWMSYLVGFRAVYAIRECSSHLSNMLRTSCLTFQSLIQFFLKKQRYEDLHGRRKEVNVGLRFY